MDREEIIIKALCQYGRAPILMAGWDLDSCVVSTAIVIDVLRIFDIKAEPLQLGAYILNAPFREWMEQSKPIPEEQEEIDQWMAATGAYGVGLGINPPDGSYEGFHVAAIVKPQNILIDLALDQASRPESGIHLKPAYGKVDEAFLLGEADTVLMTDDGCIISYEAYPQKTVYHTAPDWTDAQRRAYLVRGIAKIVHFVTRGLL